MKIILKCLLLATFLVFNMCQWPKIENIKKSRLLPSLEVKIHPPDVFQPKVQELIRQLEEKRERNERTWMKDLESAYNLELSDAAQKITQIINQSLAIFDDDNLLMKSVQYAMNPPLVVLTNNNVEVINGKMKRKMCGSSPSFKEVSNIQMNDLQKDTMKILVEDDNKIEKLRGAKVSIYTDESSDGNIQVKTNNQNSAISINKHLNNKFGQEYNEVKSTQPLLNNGPIYNSSMPNGPLSNNKSFVAPLNSNQISNGQVSEPKIKNGPIDENTFPNGPLLKQGFQNGPVSNNNSEGPVANNRRYRFKESNYPVRNFKNKPNASKRPSLRQNLPNGPINLNEISFLETRAGVQLGQQGGAVKFTKPIAVKMKLPGEPDSKIKGEIDTIERTRERFETNLFSKAKQELKLITALTLKELQVHLNHELIPFFVISKNQLEGINSVISANVPNAAPSPARFIEIDQNELNEKFPNLNVTENAVNLNKYVYSKILNLFSENPQQLSDDKLIPKSDQTVSKQPNKMLKKQEPTMQIEPSEDLLKNVVDFNYEKCLEMAKTLNNLNCEKRFKDYKILNNHLRASFLELKQQGGGDDIINVKFSANDEPYPTIEKLVAQMMTRRDLAEKFERLKILEYQSHLQKAENEMIQDILHDRVYKIVALYGPAVEGIKEHIQ